MKHWLPWAVVALVMLLSGCRSERIVTVPEYHEYVAHQHDTLTFVDSVYVHDSTATERRGDTLYIIRARVEYRDRSREIVRTDTFIQRDSVPHPVVVKVEKPLTRWQRLSLRTGNVVLRLLALLIAGGILALLIRLLSRRFLKP